MFAKKNSSSKHRENVDGVGVELLNSILFDRISQYRSHMLSQELDIVLYVEPLIAISCEVDTVRQIDAYIAQIFGLYRDLIGNFIVQYP